MSGTRDEAKSSVMGRGWIGPPPPPPVVLGLERDACESHNEEATSEGD